jgi:hypothetical protein
LSEVTFETTILDLANTIVNAFPFRDAWPDSWQDVYAGAIVDSDSENESDEHVSPDRTADRLTKDDAEADKSEEEDADEDQKDIDKEVLKHFIAPRSSDFPRNYQAVLQRLTTVPLQHLWRFSIYINIYLIAERFLVAFAKQIDPTNVPLVRPTFSRLVAIWRSRPVAFFVGILTSTRTRFAGERICPKIGYSLRTWSFVSFQSARPKPVATKASQSSATLLECAQRSIKPPRSQLACPFTSQLYHKRLHDRKSQSMLKCLRGPNMLAMGVISSRIII